MQRHLTLYPQFHLQVVSLAFDFTFSPFQKEIPILLHLIFADGDEQVQSFSYGLCVCLVTSIPILVHQDKEAVLNGWFILF